MVRFRLYTEVDLVAHDTVRDNVVLLELKTRNRDILDAVTLRRYNTQLWLTWLMFSLTYPSMAERSAAYLVIIRPGTNQVTIRSCLRPTISQKIRKVFPLLTCFCSQVLNCLFWFWVLHVSFSGDRKSTRLNSSH